MTDSPLQIALINDDATAPTYAREDDAGMDLRSSVDADLPVGGRTLISTGIAIALPKGYVGLVHPRSGLAAKHGITVLNAPGTIDSGYRGEVKVILLNTGDEEFQISKGDRIAQLVIQRVEHLPIQVVDALSEETERGSGGFGSTGVS